MVRLGRSGPTGTAHGFEAFNTPFKRPFWTPRCVRAKTSARVVRWRGYDMVHDRFASSDAHVVGGFRRIVAPIGLEPRLQDALLDAFRLAHATGEPRREAEAIGRVLDGAVWRWPWFEVWIDRFRAAGTWPRLCGPFMRALTGTLDPLPNGLVGQIQLVPSAVLRAHLKAIGRYPSPAPRSDAVLRDLALSQCDPIAIRAFAQNELMAAADRWRDDPDRAADLPAQRLAILAREIAQAVYSERQRATVPTGWRPQARLSATEAGCIPFAAPFIDRFNGGDTTVWPPFFPGDMTAITVRRPGT